MMRRICQTLSGFLKPKGPARSSHEGETLTEVELSNVENGKCPDCGDNLGFYVPKRGTNQFWWCEGCGSSFQLSNLNGPVYGERTTNRGGGRTSFDATDAILTQPGESLIDRVRAARGQK